MQPPPSRTLPHRLTFLVLGVGIVASALLTLSARVSYTHTEQRLSNLQTSLTASVLGIAPVDLERQLGEVVDLAAAVPDHAAEYRKAIAPSMKPSGPFVTSTLVLVRGAKIDVLDHIGVQPVLNPLSTAASALYERAAKTSSLVTTRVVGKGVQRLAYLVSFKSSVGTYVVSAGQALPSNHRVSIPASSPEAGLNFVIYFGRSSASDAVIETNVGHLPLTGTVSTARVPFGTSSLTLVMSPRTPLAGTWAHLLSWGILLVGAVLTAGIAIMTERLIRRRERAEHLAEENRRLYGEQRNVSIALQKSLLPRALPLIDGVELAARYIPGEVGTEVGGDWYSVIAVDEHRFAFVVGDVSGRGLSAATIMAGLRYTIRAYASLSYGPAEILNMAARELHIEEDKHFATVLVGVVDSQTHSLTMASAGHFEALVVVGGVGEFIELPIGVPLGVSGEPYAERTVPIAERSRLIAFTDGLIERRGEAIDVGLERLRTAALAESPSIDALLTRIVAELLESPGSDDDTALLGIKWN